MNLPALTLLVAGMALAAFGWWGQNTVAGQRRYDEMAGMIPMAAYWGGIALGAIAVVWLCIAGWRTGDTRTASAGRASIRGRRVPNPADVAEDGV